MDPVSLKDAIAILQFASGHLKTLLQAALIPAMRDKVIELQTCLMDVQNGALNAQAAHAALLAEVDALKQEIVRINNSDTQQARYQLSAVCGGTVLAYALKESVSGGEPPHLLCANCFEQCAKSILQQRHLGAGTDKTIAFVRPKCRSECHTRSSSVGPASYAEKYISNDASA